MNSIKIDTCGYSCPQPLVMANPSLKDDSLELIEITVDNEASLENICRAAKKQGWNTETTPLSGTVQQIRLTRSLY